MTRESSQIAASAVVDETAEVGENVAVWDLAQVREGARLGDQSSLGRGVYVGPRVQVGANCKIQNYALVYDPAVLEDGVFVGPAACLTNDKFPRAANPDGSRRDAAQWEPVGVVCRTGASIGAHAVCVAPVTIGRWATVAAGAVVVDNVPDFALVAGVPARQIGWVGPEGVRLRPGKNAGEWVCPATGARFTEGPDGLTEVSDG